MSTDRVAGGADTWEACSREVIELCERAPAWLSDEAFDRLALRVFAFQHAHSPAYARYCTRRGASPETLTSWEEIPAVPATAFKHLDLATGDPEAAEAVFRTTGTTHGAQRRGRHRIRSLAVYRASLLGPFRAHLTPEGAVPFLSLIPSPTAVPDSSLSYMVGAAAAELATEVSWLAEGGTPDAAAYAARAEALAAERRPALVLATASALVGLLRSLTEGVPPLPEGSVLMETGGAKGLAEGRGRAELLAEASERLGVPEERVVGEYGMTELLSQLYEPVLSRGPAARGMYVPPAWLRVRALDPETLAPLLPGRDGLLAFFDLANVGSVSHVLTEDVGAVTPSGVEVRGRAEGSEARGCSLALADVLASGE